MELATWTSGRHHELWEVNTGFMLPSRWCTVFSREGLAHLSKIMLKHILHLLQQHGFAAEEFGFWTGLPAVLLPSKCKQYTICKEKQYFLSLENAVTLQFCFFFRDQIVELGVIQNIYLWCERYDARNTCLTMWRKNV